jgi:hypothetical protein
VSLFYLCLILSSSRLQDIGMNAYGKKTPPLPALCLLGNEARAGRRTQVSILP